MLCRSEMVMHCTRSRYSSDFEDGKGTVCQGAFLSFSDWAFAVGSGRMENLDTISEIRMAWFQMMRCVHVSSSRPRTTE